jgi:hypothetical protein
MSKLLNESSCINSLRKRGILYTDEYGRDCIKKSLCGNKSWGMVDFLRYHRNKRLILV